MNINELKVSDVTGKPAHFRAAGLGSEQLADNALFGVEMEMENFECPDNVLHALYEAGWAHRDEGSLVNGKELVMFPPSNGKKAVGVIDKFFNAGLRYTASDRTSVHVHVDMSRDVTVGNLRATLALVYALEVAIYRFSDENRKWGSYSCPLSDMNSDRFTGIFMADTRDSLARALRGNQHEDKYYGCNAVSLFAHSTLEFRYFPCVKDKEKLMQFVNLCLELRAAGIAAGDVRKMCAALRKPAAVAETVAAVLPMSAPHLLPYLDVEEVSRRVHEVMAAVAGSGVADAEPEGKVGPALLRYREARARRAAPVEVVQAVMPEPPRRMEGVADDLYQRLRNMQDAMNPFGQ